LLSSFIEIFASKTDLDIDLQLRADTFNTTKFFQTGDFLVKGACLVTVNEVDEFLLRNLKVLSCTFSIVLSVGPSRSLVVFI